MVREIMLSGALLTAVVVGANASSPPHQWVLHFYLIGAGKVDDGPPAPAFYNDKASCEMDAQKFRYSMQPWNPTCVSQSEIPLKQR